ncbi:hypothetical protein [Aureimonas glaciei]|nr:hypothetical protein [Aureimonas glaciei]
MTRDKIAAEMGVVANTVSVHLKRLGMQRVPRISEERIQLIADMLARGRSRSTIARLLGVQTSYIYYHVRKHGLVGPRTVVNIDVEQAERDALLLRLAGEGMSHTTIARRMGTSATNVRSKLMTLAHRDEVIELNGMAAVRYVNRRSMTAGFR